MGAGASNRRTVRGEYASIQRNRSGSVESADVQTMTCPTCHGKGTVDIEPGQSPEQLVALIPYRDKRLKPRRTKLYVGLTVTMCAIASGLLLFFLLPRSVSLKLTEPRIIGYAELEV
ncbi:transmembrane protein 106B-like isoform X2 [Corticium candelabrum]|uniref:transmembrane protein 106B-like isoform X2 n=1 Tax=Corticium candelabrum TaxID=121492 RepID=UPI002E2543BD|nr:transmembrane protein 106B-like isoform X2 [Corticium candelabrum]